MSLGPGPAWHYSRFLWLALLNAAFVLRSSMKAFRRTPHSFHRPWNEDHNIPKMRQLRATEQSGKQHLLTFVHQAKSDGGREVQNANELKQGSFSVSVSRLHVSPREQVSATATVNVHTRNVLTVVRHSSLNKRHMDKLMLWLNSGSASFWGASEGQLCHSEGSSKCSLLFSVFGGCTASHIPRFFVRPKKKKERKRKWRHRVAWIVTFAGLGVRNRDVRVKRLVTQPGNAPKARLSHLTTADTLNKVSLKDSHLNTAKDGSFEGCRPRI